MDHTSNSVGLRRLLIGTALIIVGVMVCTISTVVFVDYQCSVDIAYWQPIYPGADLVEETHDFFRPRAMGRTNMTYFTPDDRRTVNQWYFDTIQERAAGKTSRGLATVRHRFQDNPDGEGTLIILFSECAYN